MASPLILITFIVLLQSQIQLSLSCSLDTNNGINYSFSSVCWFARAIDAWNISEEKLKLVHALLNVVSWGIILPLIVWLVALRFLPGGHWLERFAHSRGLGITIYILGVAGWATGFMLGVHPSDGVIHITHRDLGTALLVLGAVHLVVLFSRPKNGEECCHGRWSGNIYVLGYFITVVSVFTVFDGFNIYALQKKWRVAYIAYLVVLGSTLLFLRALDWISRRSV